MVFSIILELFIKNLKFKIFWTALISGITEFQFKIIYWYHRVPG